VRDISIPASETRLLEAGVAGLEELTYRITREDGTETERRLVRQTTIQEARPEVVLVGARAEMRPVPITGTIAYMAGHNAWVVQTSSPNHRRLTHNGDLDGRVFALSPDGAYLLFTRVGGGDEDAPLNTLWMIETAIVDAEPIPLEAENVLWAGWAPECQGTPQGSACRIAYATGERAEGSPGWKANNDLWIASPRARDGRLMNPRRIVEPTTGGVYGWWGTTYAWAPDGKRLAYARADQVGTIQVSRGKQAVLASFPPYRTYAAWVWSPTVSWSAEGEFVVSTLHGPTPTGGDPEDSPVFDIWVLGADGTITAEMVSEAGMWAAPLYAGEGDGIALGKARSPYISQSSGYDLYVMDRDGSGLHRLFPPEDELGLDYPEVAWGPGGGVLALAHQGHLFLITVSDGDVNQLTDEGDVTTVRWQW
jgi:hypothetical protein